MSLLLARIAASGTPTGTAATTNANDTASASGSPTNVGTVARTNANDTASASGSPTNVGTVARTNANDTASASGSPVNKGTSATTNTNDLATAAGNSGTTPPEPDTGTHTGGRARPRRPQQPIPQPKRLPLLLPTIGGFASCENAADRCAADGQVDPYNLLLEDEELLLLV
jgi:hypothetical protein